MSVPVGPNHSFNIAGETITWAGECPWTRSYCFGTASGKVVWLLPGEEDQPEGTEEFQVANEAVSAVAFWNDLVGISTRSAIAVNRGPLSAAGHGPISRWPLTARGIIATPRGRFVAPMGTDGLFCFDGEQASSNPGWIDRPAPGVRNYDQAVYLGERDGTEILACAARSDGVARVELDGTNASHVVSLTAPSVDLIDVCQLRADSWPFAVAALACDGSLVLVRDMLALSEKSPIRLKMEGLRGTPRSVLHALGHILVLTSTELVVFPDLSARFLAGEAVDLPVDAYHSPIQSAKVFIDGERQLLVLDEEGVRVSEILPVAPAENDRVSRLSKVKVLNWSSTRQTLNPLPTQWATLVG